MPSHAERVRRNYRCPACDGDGRVDDYDGSSECWDCDGSGIILTPKVRRASSGRHFLTTDWVTKEALAQLARTLRWTTIEPD